ncbi:hypothetical protein [Antarcticimicrobium sediminis]|nr:hypothetical protein [Antarcticimicrobium sediminis]
MVEPVNAAEVRRLAKSAIDKVDLHGKRGITLLSMQEIEALVMIAVLSGLLTPRCDAGTGTETTMFKTGETSSE